MPTTATPITSATDVLLTTTASSRQPRKVVHHSPHDAKRCGRRVNRLEVVSVLECDKGDIVPGVTRPGHECLGHVERH
jgi:hypothetical protein